ncbi:hypothetical protein K438DRAFT_1962197 [Mycena galopus ATCC 62051]|nr:hypothetical protein K438DRAFT_1962197 [Mycena galopus ATCC 62051]
MASLPLELRGHSAVSPREPVPSHRGRLHRCLRGVSARLDDAHRTCVCPIGPSAHHPHFLTFELEPDIEPRSRRGIGHRSQRLGSKRSGKQGGGGREDDVAYMERMDVGQREWRGRPKHLIPPHGHRAPGGELGSTLMPTANASARAAGDRLSPASTTGSYTFAPFSEFGPPYILLAHAIPCPPLLLAR